MSEQQGTSSSLPEGSQAVGAQDEAEGWRKESDFWERKCHALEKQLAAHGSSSSSSSLPGSIRERCLEASACDCGLKQRYWNQFARHQYNCNYLKPQSILLREAATALSPQPDLHTQILSLPCFTRDSWEGGWAEGYRYGHRAALMAAAELVERLSLSSATVGEGEAAALDASLRCAHNHTTRQVGCVSCVLVFDRPADPKGGA